MNPKIRKSHLLVVGFVLYGLMRPPLVYAVDYDYTAITQAATAAEQGVVKAGGLSWRCKGNRCTIRGPWPTPGMSACRALASKVGHLRSYGHAKAMLNAKQLAQCNSVVAVHSPAPIPSVAKIPIKPVKPGPAVTHQVPIDGGARPSSNSAAKVLNNTSHEKEVQNLSLGRNAHLLNKTIKALGPGIVSFEKVPGTCPYADPESRFLEFRVNPRSPDGDTVTRIALSRLYANGGKSAFYTQPSAPSAAVRLNPPPIADAGVGQYVVGYELEASDSKGRTTTRRLPIDFSQPSLSEMPDVTGPQASRYVSATDTREYTVRVSLRNMAIQSVSVTLEISDGRLASDSRYSRLYPINTSARVYRRVGRTQTYEPLRLPTGLLHNEELEIVFPLAYTLKGTGVYNARGNSTVHHFWRLDIRVVPVHPTNCSARATKPKNFYWLGQRSGDATWNLIETGSSSPPASPDESSTTTDLSNNGHRFRVTCYCEEAVDGKIGYLNHHVAACLLPIEPGANYGFAATIACGAIPEICNATNVEQLDFGEPTCREPQPFSVED
jgi:hypothetical protein